jgi:hypothetical protein
LEGSEYASYYQPEDAIFTQGRDYCLPRQEAVVMQFPMSSSDDESMTKEQGATSAAAAAAAGEEEDAIAYD